jgi:hypothetical protein
MLFISRAFLPQRTRSRNKERKIFVIFVFFVVFYFSDKLKNIVIMLTRLDKHFPKMDLKPINILFIPKRVDRILPNFDKILRNFDKILRNLYEILRNLYFLSFWLYGIPLRYYIEPFWLYCELLKGKIFFLRRYCLF